jgi:hypothetical protein
MQQNRASDATSRNPGQTHGKGGSQGNNPQGGAEHLYEQAKGAVSDVADRASEMWDDVYEQGGRYYREGSRVVANVDGSALAFALVAGAVGYALAYLVHGQPNWRGESERDRRNGRRYAQDHRSGRR